MVCKVGDWVQIHSIILESGQRAPQVPSETQQVPLEMWCKGFARQSAKIGEELSVTTVIGQELTGVLTAINPRPGHDFGAPVPELLDIGMKLRAKIKEANGHD